ncbi:MAG: hybrid sensor histidine kinase/response regulator [Myxococcales bacterium]|nr:hybrid sensor histidine kinase/response regulator [Myxococcales bacterium]
MNSPLNTRVLVIDDEESVRDGIKTILQPPRTRHAAKLDLAARALFDDGLAPPEPAKHLLEFHVDTARSGGEGIERVRESLAGEPYAVIFCDMRMPGLDGLETVEAIRLLDQRSEIVFITAYSDQSLESITERAGANVNYFVKPFLSEEVRQLATKLVIEWNRARELEQLITMLASLRGSVEDTRRLVGHFLEQLCGWLDTGAAMLLELDEDDEATFHAGLGDFADPSAAAVARALATYRGVRRIGAIIEADELMILRLTSFGVAVASAPRRRLTPSRRYLLEVFLENAALALRKSRIRAELHRQERLASLGQALGYVVHDLSGSFASIELMLTLLEEGSDVLGPPHTVYPRIRAAARQARALMHDTLDICRGHKQVAPERLALSTTLRSLAEVWRLTLAERGVALELQVAEGVSVHADGPMLERALWNLVNNAADAVRGRRGGTVRVVARARDGATELSVHDNGPGIPASLRARLFTPFATGKRDGNGFGLAIVKQIVEAHRGAIDVRSNAEGTSFWLLLPHPESAPSAPLEAGE